MMKMGRMMMMMRMMDMMMHSDQESPGESEHSQHHCVEKPALPLQDPAEERRAGLIVARNYGMSGFARFVIGGTDERGRCRAPCSVLEADVAGLCAKRCALDRQLRGSAWHGAPPTIRARFSAHPLRRSSDRLTRTRTSTSRSLKMAPACGPIPALPRLEPAGDTARQLRQPAPTGGRDHAILRPA